MKRFLVALPVSLLALLVMAMPISAGREWCAKDPVVDLNGTSLQILVAVPMEYVSLVNGAIDVEINTPAGVERNVVFLDAGFNGHGEAVTLGDTSGSVAVDGSFATDVTVIVPIDAAAAAAAGITSGTIPVQVTMVTNGTLTWDGNGLPWVVDGETTVVYGESNGTSASVTVVGQP